MYMDDMNVAVFGLRCFFCVVYCSYHLQERNWEMDDVRTLEDLLADPEVLFLFEALMDAYGVEGVE